MLFSDVQTGQDCGENPEGMVSKRFKNTLGPGRSRPRGGRETWVVFRPPDAHELGESCVGSNFMINVSESRYNLASTVYISKHMVCLTS